MKEIEIECCYGCYFLLPPISIGFFECTHPQSNDIAMSYPTIACSAEMKIVHSDCPLRKEPVLFKLKEQ